MGNDAEALMRKGASAMRPLSVAVDSPSITHRSPSITHRKLSQCVDLYRFLSNPNAKAADFFRSSSNSRAIPRLAGRRYQPGSIASHMQYTLHMKTATIPPVRVEPAFREEMELSLQGGENLASLVETAVRNEVRRRKTQAEFVRRGMAAIERTVTADDGVPAQDMIARLEAKLAAAKARGITRV